MTIWEYKVVPMSVPTRNCETIFESTLNEHGAAGWESCHVSARSMYDGHVKQTFMFKRPLVEAPPPEEEEVEDPIDLLLESAPQGEERVQVLAAMAKLHKNMTELTSLFAADEEGGDDDLLEEMIAQGEAITGLRDEMGAAPSLLDISEEDTSPRVLTPLPEVRRTRGAPTPPPADGEEA